MPVALPVHSTSRPLPSSPGGSLRPGVRRRRSELRHRYRGRTHRSHRPYGHARYRLPLHQTGRTAPGQRRLPDARRGEGAEPALRLGGPETRSQVRRNMRRVTRRRFGLGRAACPWSCGRFPCRSSSSCSARAVTTRGSPSPAPPADRRTHARRPRGRPARRSLQSINSRWESYSQKCAPRPVRQRKRPARRQAVCRTIYMQCRSLARTKFLILWGDIPGSNR